MTLQGAARALGSGIEQDRPRARRRGDGKWDYEANDRLQVAIDLMCLSQLCQVTVFHDDVATTDGVASGWQVSGSVLDPMRDLIRIISLHETEKELLLGTCAVAATGIADTEEFRGYVEILGEEPITGTFLRISNGYFKTGYSDPGIFHDVKMDHRYFPRAAEYVREAQGLLAKVETLSSVDPSRTAVATRIAWLNFVAHRFLTAEERLHQYGAPDDLLGHPFERVQMQEWLSVEFAAGAEDLVRNLAATIFYGVAPGNRHHQVTKDHSWYQPRVRHHRTRSRLRPAEIIVERIPSYPGHG